ncbi:MAG: (Fe-S)-binding protein, partial [Pseudohongiellaceae bacterium]
MVNNGESGKQVALFVTCLVDLVRPSLGFSVVRVLEDAGYKVIVPLRQTCCGQPNYNGGDKKGAQKIAREVIDLFSEYAFVVVPSGSCASMIKVHYPRLLADDVVYRQRAESLAECVHELSAFLIEVADYHPPVTYPGRITY